MKKWASIAFWIVVAGQLVFLLGFIAVKEVALRTGTEVVLQTVPVDPRSLLQGDYAILDYEIADLPPFMQDDPVGETVYVVLKADAGVWRGVRDMPVICAMLKGKCSSKAGWTEWATLTSASAPTSSRKAQATSSKTGTGREGGGQPRRRRQRHHQGGAGGRGAV